MVGVAVVALLCAQDADEIRRLIDALSDDDIVVRDEAQTLLKRFGDRAIPSLLEARGAADVEVLGRVDSVLEQTAYFERLRDAANRKRALHLDREVENDGRWMVRLEGAAFNFKVRRYGSGLVLETADLPDLEGRVDFDVAAFDAEGKERPVERCEWCSPSLLYVPDVVSVRPRVKGVRTWLSPHEAEFVAPRNGDFRRIGDYRIEVDWPQLRISTSGHIQEPLAERLCPTFSFETRAERPRDLDFITRRTSCSGLRGRRIAKPGWCRCHLGVEQSYAPPRDAVHAVASGAGAHELANVTRIKLTFNKPVREPFQADGPLLAPGK